MFKLFRYIIAKLSIFCYFAISDIALKQYCADTFIFKQSILAMAPMSLLLSF